MHFILWYFFVIPCFAKFTSFKFISTDTYISFIDIKPGTSIALIPYSPLALNMILYIIMDYIYATQLTPSNPSVVDYMKHLNNLLS